MGQGKRQRGSPRGYRTVEHLKRRAERHYNRAKDAISKLTTFFSSPDFGLDTDGLGNNSQYVADVVRTKYPNVTPESLPCIPTDGIFIFTTPDSMKSRHPRIPPISVIRLAKILDTDSINLICSFYDALIDGGFRFPPDKLDHNRSATSGAHLGVWSHYSLEPMVSSDSRLTTQKSLYVIDLVDKFLQCLKDVLVPVIRSVYCVHLPEHWARQEKAHRFVKAHFREGHRQEFEARISLDFGGAFFCAAIKEGGSEIFHLDFHDDPDTLTWIVPLGEGWEGGEFCLPQLGFKIPLQPGQVLGALTRRLIHCSAPAHGGRRLVLTLFCDKWIMKHSEEWVEL